MCPEKTCFRNSFGEVRGVSVGNFRGGRKLSPKSPAGRICASANLQSERAGLYLSMPPKRRDAWMLLLPTATFWSKNAATSKGLHRSPLAAVKNDSRDLPRYGHWFATSRPMAASHRKAAASYYPPEERGKGVCEKKFIY